MHIIIIIIWLLTHVESFTKGRIAYVSRVYCYKKIQLNIWLSYFRLTAISFK